MKTRFEEVNDWIGHIKGLEERIESLEKLFRASMSSETLKEFIKKPVKKEYESKSCGECEFYLHDKASIGKGVCTYPKPARDLKVVVANDCCGRYERFI